MGHHQGLGGHQHDGAALAQWRAQRLVVAVALNGAVVVVEVVAAVYGRSMALLADAGHNLTDIAALLLALMAVRLSQRAPTTRRSFGFHRSGVLAAQANAAAVLAVAVLILVGAATRFARPEHVRGPVVLVSALLAALVNAGAAGLLRRRHDRDLNMSAAVLHMAGDAVSSAAVAAVGLLAVMGWSWPPLDPLVSTLIALLIGAQALQLGRKAADVLLEGAPAGTDTGALSRAIEDVVGVDEVHDLHIWSLTPEVVLLSGHLVMSGHPTLEQAQAVAGRVRVLLAADYGIAHATLELECETCAVPEVNPCTMSPSVPAQAP